MKINTKNISILAVDDDPRNLRILEEIFEDGYDMIKAESGEEALKKVKKISPDIILLDIMMPELDGLEVCKILKNDKKMKDIKIVLVSARAMPDERTAGFNAGADHYITKPFDQDELLKIVEELTR